MKNVFLVGNGFDLHHMLPSQYFDFLCVAEQLSNNSLFFPLTAGTVLSQCKVSPNIQRCYEAHKDVFDNIDLPNNEIIELIELVNDNLWFSFFSKTLSRSLGWIDFEKEIFSVITVIGNMLNQNQDKIILPVDDQLSSFILSFFKFFIVPCDNLVIHPGASLQIRSEYLIETLYNSGIYRINKEKVYEKLHRELFNFCKALKIYFKCFIEDALSALSKDSYITNNAIGIMDHSDIVISFNYTSTCEQFYSNQTVYHIHGTINNGNIVLGLNPSDADDKGGADTSQIKFKKYYQRVVYETDLEYINWYRENVLNKNEYRLIVIGHSLDETDKDILADVFLNAKEIFVTYYNEDSKNSYIANIVKIFGKLGFDSFIRDQHLQFIPLSAIDSLKSKIKPEEIPWSVSKTGFDYGEVINPI